MSIPDIALRTLATQCTRPITCFARWIWASVTPRTDIEANLIVDQIRLTRGSTSLTDALLPVAAALIAFGNRHWAAAWALLLWTGSIALICAAISIIGHRLNPLLQRGVKWVTYVARWRTAMTIVLLAVWCSMGVVFWVPGNLVNHMFLILVLACSLAGSASILAAHPASVVTTLALHGSVLVLRPAFEGDSFDLTLAGLGFLFWIIMTGHVHVVYKIAKRARDLESERQAVIRDLTKAKAESDRERAKAAEAGRARSEFLSNMNHELRTPMNAILGFSELIKSKAFGDAVDKYVEYAEIIHDSGKYLLALIDDMLDLAKCEVGKLTLKESTFSLASSIKEMTREFEERAAAADIALVTHIEPGLPQIDADERAIRKIVTNLLSNAVKFTAPGGCITVSAARETDGRLSFAVEDNGIGIAPEDQLVVFERFGRGRHDIAIAEKGTGLGLAVVKGLAEAHDGEVVLESEQGTGTRVTVTLPAERVHSPALAQSHAGC